MISKMQELDLHTWFQQDDASFHKAHVTVDFLKGEFPENFSSIRDRSMSRLDREI